MSVAGAQRVSPYKPLTHRHYCHFISVIQFRYTTAAHKHIICCYSSGFGYITQLVGAANALPLSPVFHSHTDTETFSVLKCHNASTWTGKVLKHSWRQIVLLHADDLRKVWAFFASLARIGAKPSPMNIGFCFLLAANAARLQVWLPPEHVYDLEQAT